MSWGRRRALVYFFGGRKLASHVSWQRKYCMASCIYGSSATAAADKEICSKWVSSKPILLEEYAYVHSIRIAHGVGGYMETPI